MKTCIALETAFQKYEFEKVSGRTPPVKLNVDKMEVIVALVFCQLDCTKY